MPVPTSFGDESVAPATAMPVPPSPTVATTADTINQVRFPFRMLMSLPSASSVFRFGQDQLRTRV
ncbi:hypothetical protein GCM10027563_22920 [Parasphingorhabdus pacifica]